MHCLKCDVLILTRALFALPRSLEGECNNDSDDSDDSDDGPDTSKFSSEACTQDSLRQAERSPSGGSENNDGQDLDNDDAAKAAESTQKFEDAFDAGHDHPVNMHRLLAESTTKAVDADPWTDLRCCERRFENSYALSQHFELEHKEASEAWYSMSKDRREADPSLRFPKNATSNVLALFPEPWTHIPTQDHRRHSPSTTDLSSIHPFPPPSSRLATLPLPVSPTGIAKDTSTGTYKCQHPGCQAAFQTPYLLNSHQNVHSSDRPYFCPRDDCARSKPGRGFKRKNEMLRHGLVHDSPGYICPFCSPEKEHRYPRRDNLQRHVMMHHEDKDLEDARLREVLGQRCSTMGSAAEKSHRAQSGRTTKEQKRHRSAPSRFHETSSSRHTSPPGRSLDKFEKIYRCTWNGCEQAYRNLSHLNAHVELRSHGSSRNEEGKTDLSQNHSKSFT